jgi:hypothetical protein
MKNASLILFAVVLASAAATAQGLPDDPAPAVTAAMQSQPAPNPPAPTPAPRPDAFWRRAQQIANGEEVMVTSTYGPRLRCRFLGATDDYLFCDPPGSPAGTGYRFERATVLDVKVVPPHNWHRGFLSAIIAGGLVAGISASCNTDPANAAKYGLIGVVATGIMAWPFLLPPPYVTGAGVAIRPDGLPHPFRMFRLVHH